MTVFLPLFGEVESLEIGICEGASLSAHTPYTHNLPVVFYGSSITQGACASRPGRAYEAMISRKYDLNYIGLGFSGACRAEKAIVEYMATLEMSAFVSDYDHNAPTREHLAATHHYLYETIRRKHPDIPYFMITRPDFYYNEDTYNAGELYIFGTCTPGASIRLIPKYYKVKDITFQEEYNNEYGLTGGKYPIASWGNDTYTNWLTQNAVNIGLNALSTTASLLTGGNSDSSILGGFFGIANSLAEIYQHTFNSIQASGNVNSGDVTYTAGKLTFSGYFMTIKREYAMIIDQYFSAYGYKVNTYKLPNIYGRSNWNYVKTIGCNIIGDIPQNDIEKIKEIFNNGVTLWHNPSTFLDYSQNNTIV